MERKRVVITGIGLESPVGDDRETAWRAVREGRSCIKRITSFDTTDFDVHIAGEISDFDPSEFISKREMKRIDRFAQFAIVATGRALIQSGLRESGVDCHRVGTYIGTGIGGLHEIEAQHTKLMTVGPQYVSALMIPKLMTNAASGQVSMRFGFKGPSMSISSACASASNAIGEAFDSVRLGIVDAQVCGGSEAAITGMGLAGFMQVKALSRRNDEPQKASRPFDSDRDGFVMSEGAAVLILETLDHAKARGATILAEIVGYGASSDAFHMTLPDEGGGGAARAMLNALADAGMKPEDISYINAHGTGTPAGDTAECKAICEVFGDYARELAVSSSKSIFGHLLGASGALESSVCIWALQDQIVPPTINLDNPDPECGGLNLVPHKSQERAVSVAMNNSFGFGGHNVCLVFKRYAE